MKKKIFIYIVLSVFFISCQKSRQNEEDINKIEIGMKYQDVQKIMRNKPIKYKSKYDGDSIITKLYEAPFGASGDFKIIYQAKDSIVINIYYGD